MKTLFRLLAVSVALTFCSCNATFDRDWKAAAGKGSGSVIEGRWEGTWHSDVNGHHGALRCIVGPAINKQGDREFTYDAVWKRVLSGSFHAVHHVKQAPPPCPAVVFNGTHQMPDWAGGLYHYDGGADGKKFTANYKSTTDHGKFEMKRPAAP